MMLAQGLSPKYFDAILRYVSPILGWLAIVLVMVALVWGFFIAPADYQQQDAFRIIYLHVPAAFLSLGIYTAMALSCLMAYIFRLKVFDIWAQASAPIGAMFTLIALVTGSVWGKPIWGTWWVWDARLTSELILLFIYLGVILLRDALAKSHQSIVPAQILTMVGLVNIPIVHFSVNWWYTLHQGATLSKFSKPSMHPDMLWPLLLSIIAFGLVYLYIAAIKSRTLLWKSHADANWVLIQARGREHV